MAIWGHKMSGWIKLHRRMVDWEWFKNVNTTHVFMYLLLKANRDVTTYQGQTVPAGAGVYSVATISANSGISVAAVRNALKNLQTTNEIAIQTTNNFSIISIRKWEDYQSHQQAEQQAEQQTRQQTRQQTKQQSKQQQYKKEEDRRKNIESTGVDSFVDDAPDGVQVAFDEYSVAVDSYNETVSEGGVKLPKPSSLTQNRRSALARALRELPEGKCFSDVLSAVGQSPYLLGHNERGWRVDIDFICKKDKFIQILEGQYFGSARQPQAQSNKRYSGAELFDIAVGRKG